MKALPKIFSMGDLKHLSIHVTEVLASGRPMNIPDGWTEQSGGIHVGRGLWIMRLKRTEEGS